MKSSLANSTTRRPAILGGDPAFPAGLPLVRPSLPDPDRVANAIREVIADGGVITNGPRVRELERRTAEYLGVRNSVAVSSCTAGLMLMMRAAGLTGDVVLPSFTFAATAHAVAWAGLRPVFADVDPETLTLSPAAVARTLGVRTSAILATHTFGTPCDVERLTALARSHGTLLFFDAAHAFGSRHRGRPVGGFGDAEVFSLTPTKLLVAGEGGIIATNDDALAEQCRIGRDYGNPGDYDCRFVGLNARMSEFHAVVALESLRGLDERIERRNHLVRVYRRALEGIPGIGFPRVHNADRSTFKDFTLLVDPEAFGLTAVDLAKALAAEGIDTRRYYAPPVHSMQAYRAIGGTNGSLAVTDLVASRVLTLPLWADMSEEDIGAIVEAIDGIRTFLRGRALPAG